MKFDISLFKAKFADQQTERSFQIESYADGLKFNRLAAAFFVPLFALYAFVDLAMLDSPRTSILIRLSAALPCLFCVGLLFLKRFEQYHVIVLQGVFVVLSISLGLIIHSATDLENAYFIGFVQGGVFISVLFRMTFPFALTWMAISLASFGYATSNKSDISQISTQSLILITMFLISATACYVLQHARRREFEKTQKLKQAYEALEKVNERIEADRANKHAVAQLLLHHLRTPLHQILGFADLIAVDTSQPVDKESIGCIQTAANALSGNVERLIRYQRTEEFTFDDQSWEALHEFLEDVEGKFPQEINLNFADRSAIRMHPTMAQYFANSLLDLCTLERPSISDIAISAAPHATGTRLDIRLTGGSWTQEQLSDEMKPLATVSNYVNAGGMQWPMAVRTLSHIIAIHQGQFTAKVDGDTAHLVIDLLLSQDDIIERARQKYDDGNVIEKLLPIAS